jgi:hypothetical protein
MDRNAKIVHDNGAENIIGDHRGLRFASIGIGKAVAAVVTLLLHCRPIVAPSQT